MTVEALEMDSFWVNKTEYADAEKQYYEGLAKGESSQVVSGQCSLSYEIAKARQHIKNSLECMDSVITNVPSMEVVNRIDALEKAMEDIRNLVLRVQSDVNSLKMTIPGGVPKIAVCPPKPGAVKPPAPAPSKEDSDDGVDLFESDSDDDAAAAKIREERLAQYAAKKSNKPALIAKSSVILDVKPWDDETNMEEMEKLVRQITMDGLLWGASKFVLLAYGIKKLQINCVVEDEKVSIDLLQEKIEELEDLVQSVDIAAFNKI